MPVARQNERRIKTLFTLLACCLALSVLFLCLENSLRSRLEKSSETHRVCSICGAEKREAAVLGITYWSEFQETECSRWYSDNGMKPHAHQWETDYWSVSYWNGTRFTPSFDPCATIGLSLLRDALKKVDQTTGEELKREYSASHSGETASRRFTERCWRILRSDKRSAVEVVGQK